MYSTTLTRSWKPTVQSSPNWTPTGSGSPRSARRPPGSAGSVRPSRAPSLLLDGLLSDLGGFVSSSANDVMSLVGDITGWEVGGFDLNGYINTATAAVDGDLEAGTFAFSPLVGELLARAGAARIDSLVGPPAPDATALERRIHRVTATDPTRLFGELDTLQRSGGAVMRAAEAGDIASTAREAAATSFARGDEEQLLKRVTSPDPTGTLIPKGTADRAEDAGKLCVSTRCVAHTQLKMATDIARQSAVSTANIVTAVKEQSFQQSLTTQGLANLAQAQADAQVREYERWRDDYYAEVARATVRAQNIEDTYVALAELMR